MTYCRLTAALAVAEILCGCATVRQAAIYEPDSKGWSIERPTRDWIYESKYTYWCGDEEISVWSTVAKERLVSIGPPIVPIIPFLMWVDRGETPKPSTDNKTPPIDNRLVVAISVKSQNTTIELRRLNVSIDIPSTGQRLSYDDRIDSIVEFSGKIARREARFTFPIQMRDAEKFVLEFDGVLKTCNVPALDFTKEIRTKYSPL